jgi:hypothetical protein
MIAFWVRAASFGIRMRVSEELRGFSMKYRPARVAIAEEETELEYAAIGWNPK